MRLICALGVGNLLTLRRRISTLTLLEIRTGAYCVEDVCAFVARSWTQVAGDSAIGAMTPSWTRHSICPCRKWAASPAANVSAPVRWVRCLIAEAATRHATGRQRRPKPSVRTVELDVR